MRARILGLALALCAAAACAPAGARAQHAIFMPGGLGPYSMQRDASGTSWQPDSNPHDGFHAARGEWSRR